jgi:hypothetical protein
VKFDRKESSNPVFDASAYIMIQHEKGQPGTPVKSCVKKEIDVSENSFHWPKITVTGYLLPVTDPGNFTIATLLYYQSFAIFL